MSRSIIVKTVVGVVLASALLLSGCATEIPTADPPPDTPSLDGTSWVLDSMGGEPTAADTTVTAQFEDGILTGSGGCNRYNGKFTVAGDELTVAPLATTMMACEQAVMEQESAFLTSFQDAKGFVLDGDKLTLLDAAGKEVLVFVAQSQELPGSMWVVTGYNNGEGAVISLVPETVADVTFAKDGTLSGSGGCNRITGNYTADQDTLQIGPLASTMMACPDPAGLMQQETDVIAALESTAAYTVEGEELRLTNAEGATAVTLTRG